MEQVDQGTFCLDLEESLGHRPPWSSKGRGIQKGMVLFHQADLPSFAQFNSQTRNPTLLPDRLGFWKELFLHWGGAHGIL